MPVKRKDCYRVGECEGKVGLARLRFACNTTSQDIPVVYSPEGNNEIQKVREKREKNFKLEQSLDAQIDSANRDFLIASKYSSKITPEEFLKNHYPELSSRYPKHDSSYSLCSYFHVYFQNGRFSQKPPLFSYSLSSTLYTHTITCPVCEREERIHRRKNAEQERT